MRAVAAAATCAQDLRRVDGLALAARKSVDARVARVGEVERQLVGEQRGDVLRVRACGSRAHDRVTCSRSSTGSNAREVRPRRRQVARGRAAAGDDRAGRAAGEVDGVLERDERAEGVAEHGVALEPQRLGELLTSAASCSSVHVAGSPRSERPWARWSTSSSRQSSPSGSR